MSSREASQLRLEIQPSFMSVFSGASGVEPSPPQFLHQSRISMNSCVSNLHVPVSRSTNRPIQKAAVSPKRFSGVFHESTGTQPDGIFSRAVSKSSSVTPGLSIKFDGMISVSTRTVSGST